MGLFSWDPTPAKNAVVDPLIVAQDGASARSLPATIRAFMAGMRRFTDDVSGAITTTGRLNAYVVTTNSGLTELRAGLALLVRADRDNTAVSTLNVDGLGPLPWVDAGGVPLQPGRILKGRYYAVFLDPSVPAWRVQAGASTLDEIPGLLDLQAEVATNTVAVSQAAVATGLDRVAVAADRAITGTNRTAAETARIGAEAAEARAVTVVAEVKDDAATAKIDAAAAKVAAIQAQAQNQVLVDEDLAYPSDNAIPGVLFAQTIGPDGYYPHAITDRGSFRVYAQDDVNFAPDEDARLSPYVHDISYPDGRVQFGLRRDGDVDLALRVTDLILNRIDIARALRRHGRVGVVGDTFGRTQISATADRVLSTANGLTRPYIQRRDIASSTYLFDTVSRITLLWHGGQSNSAGAGEAGAPNSIPARPQHAMMLNTGTASRNGVVDPAGITDFGPLLDVVVPADGTSETPGPGMGYWLVRDDELTQSPAGVYLYRTHGIGGQSLAQLSKGTVSFNNAVIDLRRTREIAALYGKDVELKDISYTHGEADAYNGTSRAAYRTLLRALKNDYNTELSPYLPSDNGAIRLLIDQVPASGIGLSGREVALAQLDEARAGNGIVMVGGRQEALLSPGDEVHMKAIYRALIGEYHAKARRRLAQGIDWKPLWQIGKIRDGARIAVKLNVPVGSLRWDTDTLPPAENMGFYYGDSAGSAKIKSVEITAPDTVTFELTAVPTGSNGVLSAALRPLSLGYGTRPGAWTNLVDSDATPSFAMPGRDLRNRCVAFEEPIV
jgi:hypothetical protein